MRKRIDELEAELKASKEQGHPDMAVTSAKATVPVEPSAATNATAPTASSATPTSAATPAASGPAEVAKVEPFSDADWTWLNGNPRTKDIVWDSKFFTPEIRADVELRLRLQSSDRPLDRADRANFSGRRRCSWSNSALAATFTTTMCGPDS